MAENKKISELTRVSSLTGAEIVPFAKDGSNGAVTTAKLKEYAQPDLSAITTALGGKVDKVTGKGLSANDYTDTDKAKLTALPTKAELDASLDAKLDKSKWDAEHGQFTVVDKYINIEGRLASTENARATEFICLNHKYDIKTDAKSIVDTVYVITFYDSTGKRIKGYRTQDLTYGEDGFATLPASEFPEAAAYIRLSQYQAPFNHPYTFTNGPTQEAREGAVSEAIQASRMAAVDEELIAEANVNGAVYNDKTGFFELNTLTDITAPQMRSILNFGRFHFTNPKAGARSKNTNISDLIRTNILVSSTDELRGFVTANGLCYNQHNLEVLVVGLPPQYEQNYAFSPTSIYTIVSKCFKLHTIIGDIRLDRLEKANEMAFENCTALRNVRLRDIVKSLDISGAPLLSFDSVAFIVANAANTSPITVTVHPEVYAKLTATEHSAQARSNLALNSDVPVTSANYPMKQYQLNTVVKTGDALTITVWGTPSEGSYLYAVIENCRVEGNLVEISPGVWQKTFVLKGEKATAPHLNIYNNPNNRLEGHIDKVKICYGLDPSPQWSAPVEMPTAPEAIEAIGWERVMLMAAAKQINFATT